MKEIGGYFELELPRPQDKFIHSECVFVNSGRHALEYILRSLGANVRKIWIPFYTCEAVIQPIIKLGINYDFYHISTNLELEKEVLLGEDEYIIVNNYYGIKDDYISKLVEFYGNRMIVDNAQAWYAKEISGINSFYSPRKFFGMPDGGVASCNIEYSAAIETDLSVDRCSHLMKRIDLNAGSGFSDFRINSQSIRESSLKWMSKLTERILSSIDYDTAKSIRLSNFQYLHEHLKTTNLLEMPSMDSFECPMVYPYIIDKPSLRQHLIDNKIFVATYWPNVLQWCDEFMTEYKITKNLIPLPIDQRYNLEDMARIIDKIK